LTVNSPDGLAGTDIATADRAADVCPVGCIVVKGTGYETPYGERPYDRQPIGADIEAQRHPSAERKDADV